MDNKYYNTYDSFDTGFAQEEIDPYVKPRKRWRLVVRQIGGYSPSSPFVNKILIQDGEHPGYTHAIIVPGYDILSIASLDDQGGTVVRHATSIYDRTSYMNGTTNELGICVTEDVSVWDFDIAIYDVK
jgi:hypothetical protein